MFTGSPLVKGSPEMVRAVLIARHEAMRSQIEEVGPPTSEMIARYEESQPERMARTHKTNRGKHEVARELGMKVSELEALFIGKSVLDIGCGEGRFSADLARLKRTAVTALDHDPELLDRVPVSRDLRAVQGSGFDLSAALDGEQFDVVVSSFSSVLWANNPTEKFQAVDNALRATKVGGMALLIPIVSNPGIRELMVQAALHGKPLPGFGVLPPEERTRTLMENCAMDFMDVTAMDMLLGHEAAGALECQFVASIDNAKGDLTQERYSALASVTAPLPVGV